MATKKPISPVLMPPADAEWVDAFVLMDCHFGAVGSVIRLSAADAQTGAHHGMLDLHPNAIAAAQLALES
jgi:hypothetical protein